MPQPGDAKETWWGTQTEMFGPRNAHRVSLLFAAFGELPRRSVILEAAVGLGDVADRLRQDGHFVAGVDLSIDVVLAARSRTRAPLVVADITALPFRDGVFDRVTSAETLEHLPDDAGAVREFARVLKGGGRTVITVPALEALRTASDDYYGHLRRYSRTGLVQLFARAGLEVRSAFYWGFPFVVAYDYAFLLPLNLRRARRTIAADGGLRAVSSLRQRRWLVGLARRIFALDRFFRWLPVGVGLVMTAEKPRH